MDVENHGEIIYINGNSHESLEMQNEKDERPK